MSHGGRKQRSAKNAKRPEGKNPKKLQNPAPRRVSHIERPNLETRV